MVATCRTTGCWISLTMSIASMSLPMSCPSTTPKYRKPSSSKKIVGRYSRLSRVLSQRSPRPTSGDSRTRRYHARVRSRLSAHAMPPTDREMDMALSLRITRHWPCARPRLLSASRAMPPDSALVPAIQVPRRKEAGSYGKRRRGVSRQKCVIRGFIGIHKPADPPTLPERAERRVAAGEKLVRIALVTHVPDELVRRRIQRHVECDGQLDGSQIRRQVPTVDRARVENDLPAFGRQRPQLCDVKPANVGRRGDVLENQLRAFSARRSTSPVRKSPPLSSASADSRALARYCNAFSLASASPSAVT